MIRRPVREGEARSITRIADPVLRNLWITQAYHELSVGLAGLAAGEDATWCTFATWASKSVGQTIRLEDLPGNVDLLARGSPGYLRALEALNRRLGRVGARATVRHEDLVADLATVLEAVSRSLAGGNLAVFAEIGPLFGRFIEWFESGSDDRDKLGRFLSGIPEAAHGGDALRRAFAAYHRALGERDPKAKGERFLLANMLVGAHEQRRLQQYLESALGAPVDHLLERRVRRGLARLVPWGLLRRALYQALSPIADTLEYVWQLALTEHVLRFEMPDVSLRLGDDIPALPDGSMRPEVLETLGDPATADAWRRFDRVGAETQSRNWAEFDDRMNFIVNLFRSRQQHEVLFDPPFDDEQVATMQRGEIPPGPL